MRELRCSNKNCGRGKPFLLGKSEMMPGSVLEIKCHRCGTVTQFMSYKESEEPKLNN